MEHIVGRDIFVRRVFLSSHLGGNCKLTSYFNMIKIGLFIPISVDKSPIKGGAEALNVDSIFEMGL